MMLASAVFLIGLVTLAVPFWLHRLKSHSSDRHTFSSLFLMRASEVPVQMRRELQYRWLLGLRALLLAVVCLAAPALASSSQAQSWLTEFVNSPTPKNRLSPHWE